MNILIYDNPDEPITSVLIKNKDFLNLETIWIKDFIDSGKVFDRFDKIATRIQWWLPKIGKITNSTKNFIINRFFYLPNDWFEDFHEQDISYAKNEMWAYLLFAMNAFPNITEKPGLGGGAGGHFSLTYQWNRVDGISHLKTPEYFIGPIHDLPDNWGSEVIFSHSSNFYYWKINEPPEDQKDSLFGIKKPKGTPVICLVLDKEVTIFENDQEKGLDDQWIEKIKNLSVLISEKFNYFISEILLFIDRDSENVCFGMISNCPYASRRSVDFEEKVVKAIKKRSLRKVNE